MPPAGQSKCVMHSEKKVVILIQIASAVHNQKYILCFGNFSFQKGNIPTHLSPSSTFGVGQSHLLVLQT